MVVSELLPERAVRVYLGNLETTMCAMVQPAFDSPTDPTTSTWALPSYRHAIYDGIWYC